MKVISISDLPLKEKTACSIGNFDGFHQGHLKVLNTLKDKALEKSLKTVVITFYPHPREVFLGEKLCKITNLETKKEFLSKLSIDYFLVLPFSKEFANKTPDEFIKFLKEKLNCFLVVVGEDWKFGKEKRGNVDYLKSFIDVVAVKKVLLDKDKLSSSYIRMLLKDGKVDQVNKLLNRTYCLKGKVVKGKGIGKKLGFPTINIDPNEFLCLKFGVYAGFIEINSKVFNGAINFGVKPTIGSDIPLIEVHILDNFREDTNSNFAKVYFIKYIREEKTFKSLDDLKAQINIDIKTIEEILNDEKNKLNIDF